MKILFFVLPLLITINAHGLTSGEASGEEKFPAGGTFYNTTINDDNVNVHAFPALTGKVITQLNNGSKVKVIGTSPNLQSIDNYNGHWINIALPDDSTGWVFEKYVNLENPIVSEINVDKNGYGTYRLGNGRINFKAELAEVARTRYFIWDIKQENFHYSCVPGCYIYNKDNDEWELLTYNTVGLFWGLRSFVILTDDLKYIMIDNGTAPVPLRRVIAYNINDNTKVYDGGYNRKPSASSHYISVGYKYTGYHFGKWEAENTGLNETLLVYGRKFIKDNPLEAEKTKSKWEKYDDSFALYIDCLHNLDTGREEIVGAYWDHEM